LQDDGGLNIIPVAGIILCIIGECYYSNNNYFAISIPSKIVVVILGIFIIIVVRRKIRRRRNISTLDTAAARAADNVTCEMQTIKDESIKTINYAKPVAAEQEKVYDNPEHPNNNTYNQPAGPFENPTNSCENLLTENDHMHDASKVKKTSTSSLSLIRRKESSSKYERLSTVDEPGDDL